MRTRQKEPKLRRIQLILYTYSTSCHCLTSARLFKFESETIERVCWAICLGFIGFFMWKICREGHLRRFDVQLSAGSVVPSFAHATMLSVIHCICIHFAHRYGCSGISEEGPVHLNENSKA